ncbi:MAG: M20 family metallopeptidase [Alphaproteobacteria bacterium]|nr:M20 family metallopeptidase [Alphaproteobacteria bacterium]
MSSPPNAASLKDELSRLVGFDTQNPPGRELEAAHFILNCLQQMGCRAEALPLSEGRANVVGIFENGPGPSFAFNTHIDVVPAGEGWTGDPFKLREEGGSLFGRGSCDAKGPMVAMLEAMRQLIASRDSWSGTLLGVFVADEEVGSLGAKTYVKQSPKIDYCIIGEPTSCTTVTAHKGSLRPLVRVYGKTAHSGMPDLGVNAILKSARLLEMVVEEHQRTAATSHPLCGNASLTLTRAQGGHADNVVPEHCDFLLDRRMVPGEDEDEVKRSIAALVDAAGREAGTRAEIIDFVPTTGGASETDPGHPIVAACQDACLAHNGAASDLSGFQGGCDLVHFRSVGARGVVLGPGELTVAHQPNEYVPVDDLMRSVLIYQQTAMTMLGEGRLPNLET